MKRWVIITIIVVALVVAGVVFQLARKGNGDTQYKLARVEKGEVLQTVKAIGTVEAITQVQVGSQVTGRVIKLYADYNSKVTKDQVIAKIDPVPFQERVAQDTANVRAGRANVEQANAKLEQAEKELERDRELAQSQLISQSELDASVANRDVLAAQVRLARANVQQLQAALRLNQTNLKYTDIISPVDGIVISRNVDEGQTITASLSVQTIFLLATDLKTIQVEGSVPEADVGKIKLQQPVTFTVDAFSNTEFHGTVTQIRMAATTVQNVVTYPVIVTADNPEEKLMPGMTANLSFEVAHHDDALKIPNAALRFKPTTPAGSPESGAAAPAHASEKKPPAVTHGPQKRSVWVMSPTGLKEVNVTLGITDGSFTEILAVDVKEGDFVATGVLEKGEKNDVVNPFAPSFPTRKKPPR